VAFEMALAEHAEHGRVVVLLGEPLVRSREGNWTDQGAGEVDA